MAYDGAMKIRSAAKLPAKRVFCFAALLFAGVQSFAQQPWPGAGSGSESGQMSASNGEGAGQGGRQGREPSSSLRPIPPPPPPPPPPPLNPVFPNQDTGQQQGQQGQNSTSQPNASQPNASQPPGAPFPSAGGNQQPSVTESLLLAATEVYPGGNRNQSVADMISHIFYTAFSDQSRSFAVVFKSGAPYTYYLRNPRAMVQMGPDRLRVTYDTIIQEGNQMITGFFFSEVYYTNGKPGSLTVVNSSSGAAVVVMNLREAQP
jgi:hypothetical protein